jgi:hypothetical protein
MTARTEIDRGERFAFGANCCNELVFRRRA